MDTRIQNLSYSSNLLLHTCPRRFQLYKLNSKTQEVSELDDASKSSVTFAYGTVVGIGVQSILEGNSFQDTLFKCFLEWKPHLFDSNPKQNKDFWRAIHAIKVFSILRTTYLKDYDLVIFEGKPATELSFRIIFPDGFKYRGFVDAVLRHKVTGEILVLEVKTTSSKSLSEAQYKNSAQAVGYSIVLDHIFPNYSSYSVLYLPYLTHAMEFQPMKFTKSPLQRALWLQELLLDNETIKMYEEYGVYPMRGESCYSFFRACEYYGICTLSTSALTTSLTKEQEEALEKEEDSKYQINVTFQDLLATQISKTT